MQRNEIRRRVDDVNEIIDRAARACQSDASVPQELKQRIQELDDKSGQAKQMLLNEQNDTRIRDCIDDLEELGDRTKQACEQSGNVNQEVRRAVMQAHSELSSLKHQLH